MIIGIIIYTFRDSAGPIFEELKKTTPTVVLGICGMTIVYHLLEGLITMFLAKQYNADFTYRMGLTNAFLCSFYRVATLGSGAGVAAVLYLGENGVEHSKGFGLYMLQYAFHKISIAIYSIVLLGINWNYMYGHFEGYLCLLAAGYILTLVITLCLILFCCSAAFHKLVFVILDFMNGKFSGRFSASIALLRERCGMMESASKYLLQKKAMVVGVIALNMVKFCFWYGIPYLIFGNQSEITWFETMAVTSLSVMLAAVIPTPAGIGSTEFVFTALFAGVVGTGLAGSASLLYRFGTFVFPFLIGAVVVAARRVREKRVSFVN